RSDFQGITTIEPTVLSPSGLDLEKLDGDAMRATLRLIQYGFEAYLVGGCVRDLLLGRLPKDYDIATEARPQQVKRTFPRNCRIIGRRFKLAHLHFHGNTKILELSTFRRSPQNEGDEADLLITRDNEFGTAEEDAMRRDFTVNALFLDPKRNRILDYCNGLEDVRNRVIRTIGEPRVRFREDPVRILRAVKFAGRLGFSIEPETFAAMAETASDLSRAAPPRLLEEILRLLRGGHALDSFQLLRDVGALRTLTPVLAEFLATADHDQRVRFWRLLEALDYQVQQGRTPTNAVLLACLFVEPVLAYAAAHPGRSAASVSELLLGSLGNDLRLPRRDAGALKRICAVQRRFSTIDGEGFQVAGFVGGPFFDEALALFELRAHAAGEDETLLERWHELARSPRPRHHHEFEAAAKDDPELAELLGNDEEPGPRRRRRRRRRGGRRDESDRDFGRPDADAGDATDADGDAADGFAGAAADADAAPYDHEGDQVDAPDVEVHERQAQGGTTDTPSGNPAERKRRRRRRRRGGRRDQEQFPASAAPAPHGDAVDPDAHHEPVEANGSQTPIRPDPGYLEAVGETADEHTGEGDGYESEDGEPTTADADGDAAATGSGRKKRRRRRRRGGRGDGEPQLGQAPQGQPQGQPQRHQHPQQRPHPQQSHAQQPHSQQAHPQQARQAQPQHRQQQQPQQQPRRDRDDRRNRRDRRHGGHSDVDVVPRYRDRRGKVEVIEPTTLDLSAFDVELDPKRVPTFGSIVEGKGRPKPRAPRVPEDGNDNYRPPPPPGSGLGPDAPPPPPPPDDDRDTFGDW
ncbi:MAG: Poly(A) polymerase, partial [Planctomycetota bacterium]